MEEKKRLAAFLSGIYLLAACLLLLGVCRYCYPNMGAQIRDAVAGLEDSPVRQAFGVLTEGLEDGTPLRDAVGNTVRTLLDHVSSD